MQRRPRISHSCKCTMKNVMYAAVAFITLACLFRSYYLHIESKYAGDRPPHHIRTIENMKDLFLMRARAAAPDGLTFEEFSNQKLLLRTLEYPIETYIRALKGSLIISEIPMHASKLLRQAKSDCRRYPRSAILDHQHSLEFRFPYALTEMQRIAEHYKQPNYDLLWSNTTSSAEPLFYYLDTNHYFVVHCIYNRRNKESWDKGQQYTEEIASFLAHNSPEFQRNKGVDFLAPASHPKAGPYGVKTHTISAYQRQTFLRTDFDFNGHAPRDIIVPYYVPHPVRLVSTRDMTNRATDVGSSAVRDQASVKPKYLLFFAGAKNPPGGLREQLEQAFSSYSAAEGSSGVLFTTRAMSSDAFHDGMQNSVFCATVRGDTASSSRLFSIIASGCIPVIISDWIPLPFESIIDYCAFSMRFPESIVHNVGQLISQLRNIQPSQVTKMHTALSTAKEMLLFPPMEIITQTKSHDLRRNTYPLLNPVTLTLVEMFMRRKQYCDQLRNDYYSRIPQGPVEAYSGGDASNMCAKLYARLKVAIAETVK